MSAPDKPYSEATLIATPEGWHLYDASGKPIHALGATADCRPGNGPVLQITLSAGSMDVSGHPLFAVMDPHTGRPKLVRRIVWFDGTFADFEPPATEAPGPVSPLFTEKDGIAK